MNYKALDGYVLVTDKTRELVKKYDLESKEERSLYRLLLKKAKTEGKKYTDNPECRIWLLNKEGIDEDDLICKIKGNGSHQMSLFDMDTDENKIKSEEDSDIDILNLIEEIMKSNISEDKRLYIIKALLK